MACHKPCCHLQVLATKWWHWTSLAVFFLVWNFLDVVRLDWLVVCLSGWQLQLSVSLLNFIFFLFFVFCFFFSSLWHSIRRVQHWGVCMNEHASTLQPQHTDEHIDIYTYVWMWLRVYIPLSLSLWTCMFKFNRFVLHDQ